MSYPYNIPPPLPPVAPNMADFYYEINVPESRPGSPPRGGGKDSLVEFIPDDRDKSYHEDRTRGVGRSKEHRRAASVHVADSRIRDRSRPRNYYPRYDDDYRGRYYHGSVYSDSSHGSRDNSRERYHQHHRTPSAHSDAGYDYAPYPPGPRMYGVPQPPPPPPQPHMPGMSMALAPLPHTHGPSLMPPGTMIPWQPPQPPQSPETIALNQKIQELQHQIKSSQEESEKLQKKKQEEEKLKKEDEKIKAAVEAKIKAIQAEEEKNKALAAAKHKEITEAAQKLIEANEAARKKQVAEQEAEAARIKSMVEARLKDEAKAKPTHTKFSKAHLCKEALDEKGLAYTEHEDSFLVHRWVDRDEQNALWTRTKQIREYQSEYQKRFKYEADKAPVIETPTGPVKIVRVGNNPPVTVPVVLVTKKAPVVEDKFRHIFTGKR